MSFLYCKVYEIMEGFPRFYTRGENHTKVKEMWTDYFPTWPSGSLTDSISRDEDVWWSSLYNVRLRRILSVALPVHLLSSSHSPFSMCEKRRPLHIEVVNVILLLLDMALLAILAKYDHCISYNGGFFGYDSYNRYHKIRKRRIITVILQMRDISTWWYSRVVGTWLAGSRSWHVYADEHQGHYCACNELVWQWNKRD